jgi:hypothetical protein
MSQNADLWPRFEGEFGSKLFGGLGLLQFPEVPWAPSFNTGEIAHSGLIHDQFPSGEMRPFESTGRAVISGLVSTSIRWVAHSAISWNRLAIKVLLLSARLLVRKVGPLLGWLTSSELQCSLAQ